MTHDEVVLNNRLVARPLLDKQTQVKHEEPSAKKRKSLKDEIGEESRPRPEAIQAIELKPCVDEARVSGSGRYNADSHNARMTIGEP